MELNTADLCHNPAPCHQAKSAVLFLIFNRPEFTARVFEQIRAAKPPRLYVAADGPRPAVAGDAVLCARTRDIINAVDWDCRLLTLFRDENMGCKMGVSTAISWFFEHEDEGIVLEDDCLPENSFFMFCDTLLEKYRHDERVMHITGCNLQFGKKWGDASYYFSNRVHVWGWAGWKRVWRGYDLSLEKFAGIDVREQFKNIYADDFVAEAWVRIFDEMRAGEINSWAYALDFEVFFNNGLVIIPNKNLISNIGFAVDATHTTAQGDGYAGIPHGHIEEISHPYVMIPQKAADLTIMYRDFDIVERRKRYNAWHRRLKRWLSKSHQPKN